MEAKPTHRRNLSSWSTASTGPNGSVTSCKAVRISVVCPRLIVSVQGDGKPGSSHAMTGNDASDKQGDSEPANQVLSQDIPDSKTASACPADSSPISSSTTPETSETPQPINLEFELRQVFQSLLQEWHLLNTPNVSFARDLRSMAPDWIKVEAMARPGSTCEILKRLEEIGIGTDIGTISFFKADMCKTASPWAHSPFHKTESSVKLCESIVAQQEMDDEEIRSVTGTMIVEDGSVSEAELDRQLTVRQAEESKWSSPATKVRIEQVREDIAEQTAFSFDYVSLLTVSSILAGIGLVTDNTVIIVASMLVSPIMGPVMGLTFGYQVRDWNLVRRSLRNEILSLLVLVMVGALLAICASFSEMAEADWPTEEMRMRGSRRGLAAGVAIAIPSGMGICVGMLGGNTSSLVGVAISASLLPPAVNTGICLVYAILLRTGQIVNDNETAKEMYEIAGISFTLTLLNIFCIWLSGVAMFKIKQVAPAQTSSQDMIDVYGSRSSVAILRRIHSPSSQASQEGTSKTCSIPFGDGQSNTSNECDGGAEHV